jgi:hypothetical protein
VSFLRRRNVHRTPADDRIRGELNSSLERTVALRESISAQWTEIREITKVTQPRLQANGFTDAITQAMAQRSLE